MSRNGSGIYSLPAVYDVSDGDTSAAAQITTPFEDLESDANTARPIVAGGTGGTTAAAARSNLSVYSKAETDAAVALTITGPSSAVSGNFVAFDGTTGTLGKDSGKSAASFATATQGATADSATQAADLASTAASKGASLVGVQDSDGNFTGTTVEAVLSELYGLLLGVGQTWQDVSGSRAINTTYTNSTGKPIQANVSISAANAASAALQVYDGTNWLTAATSSGNIGRQSGSIIIPPSGQYRVSASGGGGFITWLELR